MRIFWNDFGRGPTSEAGIEVDLHAALSIWSDEVHGGKGNFLGLIDSDENVIQFYFNESIPDHVDDARFLRIIDLDFPQPNRRGSYSATITIGEVQALIRKVFETGAHYRCFEGLTFLPW